MRSHGREKNAGCGEWFHSKVPWLSHPAKPEGAWAIQLGSIVTSALANSQSAELNKGVAAAAMIQTQQDRDHRAQAHAPGPGG